MVKIKDYYINQCAKYLADEGERLIKAAFASATFNKNKTQNLHDSYGSCVFFEGKEVSGTRRYAGAKAATVGKKDRGGRTVYGRSEIDNYFNNYATKSDGFELVTAVAIFYGDILEKGKGKLRRKYVVISGIDSAIRDFAKRMGGTVTNINI